MNDDRTSLETRAQELLRASAEQLDGHTRSRLNQARHIAIAELERGTASRLRWLLPAGATAAAAVAVLMIVNHLAPTTNSHSSVATAEDIDLITSEESLDLYQELEFYTWLSQVHSDDWSGDWPVDPMSNDSASKDSANKRT